MTKPPTDEELLEMILYDAINEELSKDIIGHVVHGRPMESTPVIFETEEDRARYIEGQKILKERVEDTRRRMKDSGMDIV